MEVRSSITVRIIGIGLYIVNIPCQEHHVLYLPSENRIHNHLSFPFKPCPVRPSSPAIVSRDTGASSLRNGQRHTRHNHFPCRRRLGEALQQPLKLLLSQHRLPEAVLIGITTSILPRIEQKH